MIKTRLCGRNKPLFRTCKQSESVQSHAKTTLGVNVKIQSDIAVTDANAITSLGVNGPLIKDAYRPLQPSRGGEGQGDVCILGVSVSGGGSACRGVLPRGVGVCLAGGDWCLLSLARGCSPPLCGQTDTCENIIFPQRLLRTVIKLECYILIKNLYFKLGIMRH